jgi:hypothetical protein
MNVKFLAQGNNVLPLTGFEPTRSPIVRLLVRRVNHSATPPHTCERVLLPFKSLKHQFLSDTYNFNRSKLLQNANEAKKGFFINNISFMQNINQMIQIK